MIEHPPTIDEFNAIEAELARVAVVCEKAATHVCDLPGSDRVVVGLRRSARTADEARRFTQEARADARREGAI